jgi:hypothetical protein
VWGLGAIHCLTWQEPAVRAQTGLSASAPTPPPSGSISSHSELEPAPPLRNTRKGAPDNQRHGRALLVRTAPRDDPRGVPQLAMQRQLTTSRRPKSPLDESVGRRDCAVPNAQRN